KRRVQPGLRRRQPGDQRQRAFRFEPDPRLRQRWQPDTRHGLPGGDNESSGQDEMIVSRVGDSACGYFAILSEFTVMVLSFRTPVRTTSLPYHSSGVFARLYVLPSTTNSTATISSSRVGSRMLIFFTRIVRIRPRASTSVVSLTYSGPGQQIVLSPFKSVT